MASFKVLVLPHGETEWVSNAVRLATEKEALSYANDLKRRWSGAKEVRVAGSDDEVTNKWDERGGLVP